MAAYGNRTGCHNSSACPTMTATTARYIGFTHVPIQPTHDQARRRRDRRWCTQALHHEPGERVHQHGRAGSDKHDPDNPQGPPIGERLAQLPPGQPPGNEARHRPRSKAEEHRTAGRGHPPAHRSILTRAQHPMYRDDLGRLLVRRLPTLCVLAWSRKRDMCPLDARNTEPAVGVRGTHHLEGPTFVIGAMGTTHDPSRPDASSRQHGLKDRLRRRCLVERGCEQENVLLRNLPVTLDRCFLNALPERDGQPPQHSTGVRLLLRPDVNPPNNHARTVRCRLRPTDGTVIDPESGKAQADDLGFRVAPPDGIEPSTYAYRASLFLAHH